MNQSPRQPYGVPQWILSRHSPLSLAFAWSGVQYAWNWQALSESTKFSCFYSSFPSPLAHWAGSKQLCGAAQGYPSRCGQPWGARPAFGCQKNSLSPLSHWADSDSSANTDGFSQENGAVKLQKQTEALFSADSLAIPNQYALKFLKTNLKNCTTVITICILWKKTKPKPFYLVERQQQCGLVVSC